MRIKAMKLNFDNLASGTRPQRLLNAVFAASAVGLLIWLLLIWIEPLTPSIDGGKAAPPPDNSAGTKAVKTPSYSIIVEKDLFSPVRHKYSPPPPKPVVAAPPPPPPPPPARKAPPRLTLLGTVILDDGEAAIMEFAGSAQKGEYYRVGDMIEEFQVKEIRKETVVLERDDGVVLRVAMSSSSPGSPAGRIQTNRDQGGSGQSDIPASLVPRPPAPGGGPAPAGLIR